MNRKWFVFFSGVLLALGSLVGALVNYDQRATYVRGWEDATSDLEMPLRLPLMGVNVELTQYTDDDLAEQLDRIAASGFTWVRQTFRWDMVESLPGEYDWVAYDRLVDAVEMYDSLQIVAVIDGTPAWARNPLAPEHPFAPPSSVTEFASFAGEVARRYAGAIDYYQIWDEPNITLHWGNLDPRPAHYAAMLRGSYSAIHDADPVATVIAAALAPTTESGPSNINEVDFLRALYEQGIQDCFDAVAGKPYGFDLSPDDRTVDPAVMNFSRIILLREEMVRQGDSHKPIWGSNFGWNSLPDGWVGPPSIWGSVNADQQEQYTQAAYERAAREWPWMAGLILQHWDPDVPDDDPLQGFSVNVKIESWQESVVWAAPAGMISGAYPVENPYTFYSANWRFSDLGVDAEVRNPDGVLESDENRIELQFYGTDLALPVRRDDYAAYLYIAVDGQPANALPVDRSGDAYLILTSPERTPEFGLIKVAKGLPEGLHTVEIVHRPYNGDDRWPIAGYAIASVPDLSDFNRARALVVLAGIAGLGLMAYAAASLPWGRLYVPSVQWFQIAGEWFTGFVSSILVLIGAFLAWGDALEGMLKRDPPAVIATVLTAGIASLSPIAIVTILALAIIFVLIYNRPLIGVLLTIFWSAFFLSSLDVRYRLFATVEIYLVMTLFAVVLRVAVDWAQGQRDRAPRQREAPVLHSWRTLRLNAVDWLVLAFVAVALVSLSWSTFMGVAVRQLRVVILEPVLLYGLIRVLRLEKRDVLWLGDMVFLAGMAIAVVGLLMFVVGDGVVETGGTRRLSGVYGSPNGIGLYMGRVLPFALAYAVLAPQTSWRKVIGVVGTVVMLLAVLLSQSRGAIFLGIPAALSMMLVIWRGRGALVPLTLLLAGIVLILIPLSVALPRLSNLLGDTAFFRTQLWYSSLNLLREHPITGVGLDQFLYWYRSRYLLPEAWAEPNLSIPHNIFLNFWVNLGIAGVIVAGGLVVMYLRMIWRLRARIAGESGIWLALLLALVGSMADALAHGLVDIAYFSINLAFMFFVLLALLQRLDDIFGVFAENAD